MSDNRPTNFDQLSALHCLIFSFNVRYSWLIWQSVYIKCQLLISTKEHGVIYEAEQDWANRSSSTNTIDRQSTDDDRGAQTLLAIVPTSKSEQKAMMSRSQFHYKVVTMSLLQNRL